jgi:hypothetical protein
MALRPFKFILLASIVFWTSGAAQYVHELVEHKGPETAVARATEAPRTTPVHPDKKSDHHDHDDCPTCQLLAHMSADVISWVAPICGHLRAHSSGFPTDLQLPPASHSIGLAPIRGPPAPILAA